MTGQYIEDDDGTGTLNSRIIFTPPKEDVYSVIATTLGGGRTGEYHLTVATLPPGASPPVRGMPVTILAPVDVGDLTITPYPPFGVNNQNTGNNELTHGYIEYRFTIDNNSEDKPHRVTLTMPRHRSGHRGGHHLLYIKKSVDVQPLDSVEVSLFQSDLPLFHGSDVEVMIDGKVQHQAVPMQIYSQRGVQVNQWMSGIRPTMGPATMINILSPSEIHATLNQNVMKSAVGLPNTPIPGVSSWTPGVYQVPGPYLNKAYTYSMTNRFIEINVPMTSWSKDWLGYTSFDAIAVTGPALQTAPAAVQEAIFEYTESGGMLLVVGPCKLPESWLRSGGSSKYFKTYYPGFGQCLLADERAIHEWDPDEWREVTGAWRDGIKAWEQLRNPTAANRDFPVVENLGIPVRGLFLFMILFVVLIGPLNLYWLTRTRRRIWLLWTVPAFSLVTCVLLFGYMMLTEGWHGHVRADSVTVLDEARQRGATVGWLGFYSPTTPGGGLQFSDDTELTPHLVTDRMSFRQSGATHPQLDRRPAAPRRRLDGRQGTGPLHGAPQREAARTAADAQGRGGHHRRQRPEDRHRQALARGYVGQRLGDDQPSRRRGGQAEPRHGGDRGLRRQRPGQGVRHTGRPARRLHEKLGSPGLGLGKEAGRLSPPRLLHRRPRGDERLPRIRPAAHAKRQTQGRRLRPHEGTSLTCASASIIFASTTAAPGRSTTSRSPSRRGRSSASSAPTAPARRRPCASWPRSTSRPTATPTSTASPCRSIPRRPATSSATCPTPADAPRHVGARVPRLLRPGLRPQGGHRRQVVEHIEEFTNLIGIREKPLVALSKGMKHRVSVARALVHDPPVLIMDEPAAGLDPRARIELRELLKVLSGQGKAILISSHILTELAEICNGVIIIEHGRILRAGKLDQVLAGDVPQRTVHIRVLERHEDVYKHLLETPNVEKASLLVDNTVEVEVNGTRTRAAICWRTWCSMGSASSSSASAAPIWKRSS